MRNAPNVEFYQGNAEDLFYIESDSVDFLNFAYVMHEMPKENAKLVAQEMYRVLKPGGILNGFEVPFVSNPISREVYILFQTWGNDWHVQVIIHFDHFLCICIFKILIIFFFRVIKAQNPI